MVNIGVEGRPRMFTGQIATINNGSNIQTGVQKRIETDIVGQGYLDSTPILPPEGSAAGAVVITTPKMFQGLAPRHNTPSGPPEQGGKVMMDLVNNIYRPRIGFTPIE